ncbi:MAG: hypothetical protein Q8R12_04200 [bacterium]|nr:hypothetical protein [bacterium]
MATANIKKRTGIKIKDIFVKKRVPTPSISKPLPAVAPIPKMFEVKEPKTITKPLKKKADLADKKAKSLFKFLDDSGIEQPDKLLVFIRWYALPRQLRKPETQEKLSEKIGIHKDTFANWKRKTGFWNEVSVYTNLYFRSHAPDVFYALVQNAKKTGDPRAVKLFAQLFEGWSEKIRTEDDTPEKELDPELQEQIRHAIHNIGLSTIKRGYETDEDEGLSTENNE